MQIDPIHKIFLVNSEFFVDSQFVPSMVAATLDGLERPLRCLMKPTYEELKLAFDLAVCMIMKNEPPDSRAVSNEAVALCALSCGDNSKEVMNVIEAAANKGIIK